MNLAADQASALAAYVRSFNADAFETPTPGDPAAGERFFFGTGNCGSCHMAAGRGESKGPDLSNIARQLTLPELEQSLTDPSARIAPGYGVVDVTLHGGLSCAALRAAAAATICNCKRSTASCTC